MNGNELTRSDGARFVLKGVAVHFVPEYNDQSMVNTAETDWMFHTDILSEMQSMGINAIRIPINTDMYQTGQVMSKADWLQRFRDIVTAANSYGIRVMFGWWDSLSEQGSWANQYANAFPAMADVVNAIGPNPMVMYEPWNEPNGVRPPTGRPDAGHRQILAPDHRLPRPVVHRYDQLELGLRPRPGRRP